MTLSIVVRRASRMLQPSLPQSIRSMSRIAQQIWRPDQSFIPLFIGEQRGEFSGCHAAIGPNMQDRLLVNLLDPCLPDEVRKEISERYSKTQLIDKVFNNQFKHVRYQCIEEVANGDLRGSGRIYFTHPLEALSYSVLRSREYYLNAEKTLSNAAWANSIVQPLFLMISSDAMPQTNQEAFLDPTARYFAPGRRVFIDAALLINPEHVMENRVSFQQLCKLIPAAREFRLPQIHRSPQNNSYIPASSESGSAIDRY
jgi:hypothetical protein